MPDQSFADALAEMRGKPAAQPSFADALAETRTAAPPAPSGPSAATLANDALSPQGLKLDGAPGQMSRDAIPSELKTLTPDELNEPGTFQNPRTGRRSTRGGDQAVMPVLDSPIVGGKSIVEGIEQMAEGTGPDLAGGADKVVRGGLKAAEPLMVPALLGAPVATLAGVGIGTLAQTGVEKGLRAAGVRPEYSSLAGDVVGLGAGAVGGHFGASLQARFSGAPIAPNSPINLPSAAEADAMTTAAVDAAMKGRFPEQAPEQGQPAAAPQTPTAVDPEKLPEDLAGAKPKYNFAKKSFDLDFESDVDKAAYISAQKLASRRNQDYIDHVVKNTGLEPDQVRSRGQAIRDGIKEQARTAEPGRLTVPRYEPPEEGTVFADEQEPAQSEKPDHEPVETSTETAAADGSFEKALEELKNAPATDGTPRMALGGYETVKTPNGTKAQVRHAFVEADDAVTSHDFAGEPNPDYNQDLQLRDRSRASSGDQLRTTAAQIDAREVGSNYLTTSGAPIADDGAQIISGNNRTNALKMMYEQHPEVAERYRADKAADLEALGFHPDALEGFQKPVHIRILDDNKIDPVKFADESNQDTIARMSAAEQAAADSTKLDDGMMQSFQPSEDGEIHTAGNRDFVRQFVDKVVSKNQRGDFMTSDGTLSQAGISRIRNAVFHYAYGDPTTLEKLAESPDSGIKTITNGMLQAAPRFGKLNVALEAGNVHPVDFRSDIAQAVQKISDLRESGLKVKDYLDQAQLFGSDITPEARAIVENLEEYKRSKDKIGRLLNNVADAVENAGNPKQESMFDDGAVPSKAEVLQSAIRETEIQIQAIEDAKRAKNDSSHLFPSQVGEAPAEDAGGGGTAIGKPDADGTAKAGSGSGGEATGNEGLAEEQLQPRRGRDGGRVEQQRQQQLTGGEEVGPHGPVLREFRHDGQEAVDELVRRQSGEAVAALHHSELGDIDLVWGKTDAQSKGKGYGLSHIISDRQGDTAEHAEGWETANNLQRILDDSHVTENDGRRAVLESDDHRSALRLNWNGKEKRWLISAFRKEKPLSPDGSMFVPGDAPMSTDGLPPSQSGSMPSAERTFDVSDTQTVDRQAPPPGGDSSIASDTPGKQVSAKRRESQGGSIDPDLLTLGAGKFLSEDVVPKAKEAAAIMRAAQDDLRSVLAPASRGPVAKEGAMVIRENAADLARRTDRAEVALRVARQFFGPRSVIDNVDFMDRMETGKPQQNLHDQSIAATMRDMLEDRKRDVQNLGTGQLKLFYKNYFPHYWKDPKAAAAFIDEFYKKNLSGSGAFLKQRAVPTIKNGLDAGLELPSNNPVDLVLRKVREMDKYITAHQMMADLQDRGHMQYVEATDDDPVGWARINDKIATVYGQAEKEGAMQIDGRYVAPEPVARLMNNYLSPGLREKSGIFRAYLGLSNTLNQFQLGYSAFHLGFTTADVAVSRVANGISQVAGGRPLEGLKTMASAPVAPFTNLIRGNRMLKEWYKPGSQGADVAAAVEQMQRAGGRARMDSFYRTNMVDGMMDALRSGNVIGAALRAPFALTEAAMKPVLEYVVPRQKMGIFAEMARTELDNLGPNATNLDAHIALARAWDSVDNRMGQLVYDNLFWNKTAKDLAMASVRSVGWNLGTIRELGGGVVDFAKAAGDLTRRKPIDWSPRMSYSIALPMVMGVLGAVAHRLMTGQNPEGPKDLYFPKDERGQRWMAPSYIKDVYDYKHDPLKTIRNKINPTATTIMEMLTNKDWRNHPIHNSEDPFIQQRMDDAKHVVSAFTPMAFKNASQGNDLRDKVLPFVGITHAPKAIDQ